MKLTERGNALYLEDITASDLRFANLAGRLTGSIYEDPDKPKHVYVVWLDEETAAAMRAMNLNVREMTEYDRIMKGSNEDLKMEVESNQKRKKEALDTVRYSVQFKAYPKIRTNRRSGREEQYPKVILKTLENMVRLNAESFGLVDSAHIERVDICFHLWQYDKFKSNCVAVIDELWVTVDEGAGEIDEGYLDEKYGYIEEDNACPEE